MTRYERISLVVSSAAFLVSLTTPIITYYYFDTSTKDYKHRAVFVPLASKGSGVETDLKPRKRPLMHQSFQVLNAGERPAESAQIAVQYYGSVPSNHPVQFEPPIDYSMKKLGSYHFYTLTGAVAPGTSLSITFNAELDNAYIYTKHGDKLALWESGFHGLGETSD